MSILLKKLAGHAWFLAAADDFQTLGLAGNYLGCGCRRPHFWGGGDIITLSCQEQKYPKRLKTKNQTNQVKNSYTLKLRTKSTPINEPIQAQGLYRNNSFKKNALTAKAKMTKTARLKVFFSFTTAPLGHQGFVL